MKVLLIRKAFMYVSISPSWKIVKIQMKRMGALETTLRNYIVKYMDETEVNKSKTAGRLNMAIMI